MKHRAQNGLNETFAPAAVYLSVDAYSRYINSMNKHMCIGNGKAPVAQRDETSKRERISVNEKLEQ